MTSATLPTQRFIIFVLVFDPFQLFNVSKNFWEAKEEELKVELFVAIRPSRLAQKNVAYAVYLIYKNQIPVMGDLQFNGLLFCGSNDLLEHVQCIYYAHVPYACLYLKLA